MYRRASPGRAQRPPILDRGRMITITFSEPRQSDSGAVVVVVWEEGALTPAGRALDEATSGAIRRALSAAPRFNGKKHELLPIIGAAGVAVGRIVLAGLGGFGAWRKANGPLEAPAPKAKST